MEKTLDIEGQRRYNGGTPAKGLFKMNLMLKPKNKPLNTRLTALMIVPIAFSVFGLFPQEGLDLVWPSLENDSLVQNEAETASQPEESSLLAIQENSLLPLGNMAFSEERVVERIRVVITAYSSSPWETDDTPYITASGTFVREGITANNLLPFGTKFKMPELFGDRVFVVEDRLNAKKGYYHVDIWFPSRTEALAFGTKRSYIEIIKES